MTDRNPPNSTSNIYKETIKIDVCHLVKHGHWIEEEYSKEDDWGINNFHYYICSECHKKIPNQHFDKSWVCCPYCGAEMIERKETKNEL